MEWEKDERNILNRTKDENQDHIGSKASNVPTSTRYYYTAVKILKGIEEAENDDNVALRVEGERNF